MSLPSLNSVAARKRYLRVQRKQRWISSKIEDAFHAATGRQSIRLQYTREFYYNNAFLAVTNGIPPDLCHCPPSKYRGGEPRLDYVIRLIKKGKIHYTVASQEEFFERKQDAIELGLYDPEESRRQDRPDKGNYHYRSKRLLWGPVPPKSDETVDESEVEAAVITLDNSNAVLRRSTRILSLKLKQKQKQRDAEAKYVWKRK